MTGTDPRQEGMFSYISPEARVPVDHPLRAIRKMVNRALEGLTREFDAMYSPTGRPSIAPEQLLRALLLQVLYSIRSERLLVEQLDYNLLLRLFVGLSMDDPVWEHSTFTKNRERLIGSDIARAFFGQVLGQAREGRLLSDEHFSVDGTLLEGVGLDEIVPAQRWRRTARCRWTQYRGGLPRREAQQCDPPVGHRSAGTAVPQAQGAGSEAGLPRPCVDG